ncbi:hypothetical protein ACOSP7_010183 [Xanthoceras sorbifolium]
MLQLMPFVGTMRSEAHTVLKVSIGSPCSLMMLRVALPHLRLLARKVPTGSICPLCKVGSETPVHALWSCYKLKPVQVCFRGAVRDVVEGLVLQEQFRPFFAAAACE